MAGDWIKFEMSTITKPEVLKIARILAMDRHAVVGRLIVFWSWCDANSVDGVVDATVDATVDALVDAPGFSHALVTVGWLKIDAENEQITIPNFNRHNGKSAKNRVLKTERQAKWRASKAVDASVDGAASTREEKRRVLPPKPPASGGLDDRMRGQETKTNGAALTQVQNTRGPDQLGKVMRRLGLGDGPAGLNFDQTKSWALNQLKTRDAH